jgi:uncharacterized membrane protein YgaE (UPF0421/DUF939 family)
VLAPLTALLVAQVSIYQTVRSAVRRVASVVAGVLLALGLSASVGFTWWSLGIAIALGLAVGYALHLREEVLEVPISAMLILSVGTRSAATGRVVETFIGTAVGLVAGSVLTSPRVQPAEEAIEELCGTMAGLLDRMAAGLRADLGLGRPAPQIEIVCTSGDSRLRPNSHSPMNVDPKKNASRNS